MADEQQKALAVASLKPELWTASLSEATTIYITDTKGSAQSFKPVFTYPIFGDAESVFGYQDLSILLCFDAVTFYPFLNVKWKEKLQDVDVDPKVKMLEYLPESTVFKDEAKWRDAIDAEQQNFTVPGEIVGEKWEKNGEFYAIYKLNMSDPRAVELQKRLQILVLLFIEAGSYIEYSDPLWDIYVMYRVTDELPEIVGFTTAYNYWKYPGADKFDAGEVQIRKKISQFIILPPYQGQALGRELYSKLFDAWLKDDKIVEIVVEEPNESFDDLRDRADFERLAEQKIDLNTFTIADASAPGWFDKFKASEKLEKRQLQRLLEMVFLWQLKAGVAKDSKKAIRLFVKRRLFEKNKEALVGMDEPTKLDKLHTAYEALEADYYRILEPLEVSGKRKAPDGENGTAKRAKVA